MLLETEQYTGLKFVFIWEESNSFKKVKDKSAWTTLEKQVVSFDCDNFPTSSYFN